MMAGKRRLAAAAFCTLAPIVTAVLVLAQWRWIVGHGAAAPAALSGPRGEILLAAAFVVLVLSLLTWIIQALDGARRVSWGRTGRPGGVSFALLLALGAFATTFRPQSVAGDLDLHAGALHAEGLRLIPWGLSETAAWLDPATARYQVRAAELATELGMEAAAASRWESVDKRSEEWAAARRALPGNAPDGTSEPPAPAAPESPSVQRGSLAPMAWPPRP